MKIVPCAKVKDLQGSLWRSFVSFFVLILLLSASGVKEMSSMCSLSRMGFCLMTNISRGSCSLDGQWWFIAQEEGSFTLTFVFPYFIILKTELVNVYKAMINYFRIILIQAQCAHESSRDSVEIQSL